MSKCILIIDDEACIQEVIQISLETIAGWDVITASSGEDGIAKAIREQPDAILLDVMMPYLDGLATFQRLQADPKTQQIPVLLLTAKIQTSELQQYKKMGVKGAISKPFEPMQLAQEVAKALGWLQYGNY
jgi:CheY-like chemotaxis protein